MSEYQIEVEDEDYPTARTCDRCQGEGVHRKETTVGYTVFTCRACNGTGRIPMSGETPAVRS
jgi:DnaJ-class molecular chaperone